MEQGERGVADAEAALEKANAQASRLESEAAGDAEDEGEAESPLGSDDDISDDDETPSST